MSQSAPTRPPLHHLVTTAFPYANNHLHLGHMLEQIQADIWVRALKLQGQRVALVSAIDGHGTAIMLQAQREGRLAEDLIEDYRRSHLEDAQDFGIEFDRYDSTHRPHVEAEVQRIYARLIEVGAIFHQEVEQFYDHKLGLFLADRMVRGGCPRCRTLDQYGDHCEVCGATYESHELIEPHSALSQTVPTLERSMHYWFNLGVYQGFLKHFIEEGMDCDASVRAKLQEWIKIGLKPWDISRDEPYFGFPIPECPGKYFYVWLDAPIGYIALTSALFKALGWQKEVSPWSYDSPTEVTHCLGKDITYFHGLFWPALLKASGQRPSHRLWVHGHVTLSGRKMSKSRGNFLFAREFKRHLPPESLRYYFASRLQGGVEDVDLSLTDLVTKFNSDIVNKWLNLAARSARLLEVCGELHLSKEPVVPGGSFDKAWQRWPKIQLHFQQRDFASAIRELMDCLDEANRCFNEAKPWLWAKRKVPDVAGGQGVCTEALQVFLLVALGLKPVVPRLVAKVEAWVGENLSPELIQGLGGRLLKPYSTVASRLKLEEVEPWIKRFSGSSSSQT